jgi:hypothetical protein
MAAALFRRPSFVFYSLHLHSHFHLYILLLVPSANPEGEMIETA